MIKNTLKTTTRATTRFGASEAGRWETEDMIEVCEGPAWHGRSPERRYVAQRISGGPCAWGSTRAAALEACRAANGVSS